MMRPRSWKFRAKLPAEGAMEKRGEEVLGLTQRLLLHRSETIHTLDKGRELLLQGERRQGNCLFTQFFAIHLGDIAACFGKAGDNAREMIAAQVEKQV